MTTIQDLIDHAEELLDAMDGMDVADYPMVGVLCDLVQQDCAALRAQGAGDQPKRRRSR